MKIFKALFFSGILLLMLASFHAQPKRKYAIQSTDIFNLKDEDVKVGQPDMFLSIEMEALEFVDDDVLDSTIKIISLISFAIILFSFKNAITQTLFFLKQDSRFLYSCSSQSYLQVFRL
jgi:hypothetical protein